MAIGSTAEEIFRFSVVRNPQALDSAKLEDTVVRIAPDKSGRDHAYLTELSILRARNPTRRAFLDQAARMMQASAFVSTLETLKTPLWQYVERVQGLPKLTLSGARDLIEAVFGKDAGALVQDDGFRADSITIADSLVLASVVPPLVPGLRTRLMQARRAIAFIERLASARARDLDGSERLLSATLMLPASVFPIPDNNKGRQEENKKAYERKQATLEKGTARAQRLLNDLARNREAADELSDSLSKHLFDLQHADIDRNTIEREVAEAPGAPLSVLPAKRVRALNAATRELVLDELKMPENAVDVPFAVGQIEKANVRLGHELATNFSDLLVDAGPFWLPTCGECKAVVLPEPKAENNFTSDTRGLVEVVGIQDLLIVRQKLLEYRAGEISHIENILEREKKVTTHRKLSRTEITMVDESEKEREVENELQTTDKYELQSEASRVIQQDRSLEAGVTITASYGSVNIESHGNYASSNSTQESRSSASSFARDVVSRSLQRIRERVLTRRTRTELTEVEITNLHEFNNVAVPTSNVAGVYRWVDKFYEAQIVNYGKRFMLEFMIPEPGAFYRHALARKPAPATDVPRPEQPGFCRNGVFNPLSPADLQPENYLCLVAKYNVKNVQAPSPRYQRVSDALKYKIDNTQGKPVAFTEVNDSFKIPEGYAPKSVNYVISGGNSHSATTKNSAHDDIILAVVTIADRKVFRFYRSEIGEVGGEDGWPEIGQVIEWGNPLSLVERQFGSYSIGNLSGGFSLPSSTPGAGDPDLVKVSLTGHTTLPTSVVVHYTVLCERSPTKFQQWQIDTFNAIMDAYQNMRSDYDDAQQARINAAEPGLEERNPLLNREIERRELKKFSISVLTGQQYESFNAMEEDYRNGIPQINLTDAGEEGKFVRFFEQALEWRNMTYLFYPYFWGRKDRWADTLMTSNSDPLFEQFLQSGYARVWVPVRPGFDAVIGNYLDCGGDPWTEKDAPIAGRPDEASSPTVALIDEIKEQLGADFTFRQGNISVKKDDHRVVGTGTDFTADDEDREIIIALRTYRIAAVDEAAQELRLREPYAGNDAAGIGVAIGVKYVGEPWVVQVPTTLVYLGSSQVISE